MVTRYVPVGSVQDGAVRLYVYVVSAVVPASSSSTVSGRFRRSNVAVIVSVPSDAVSLLPFAS
jgi:hypothetical protein